MGMGRKEESEDWQHMYAPLKAIEYRKEGER
jgi:hypothetical protein